MSDHVHWTCCVVAAPPLSCCGVMTRSSAPPTLSPSSTRPRRNMSTSRNTLVTTKGMLGMTAWVNELLGGTKYWMTEPAMPIASPTATAIGRLRSRAAITAAKAETMSRVKLLGSRPSSGAETTPTSPARKVLARPHPG